MRQREADRKALGLVCGGFLCCLCIGTDRAAVRGPAVLVVVLCGLLFFFSFSSFFSFFFFFLPSAFKVPHWLRVSGCRFPLQILARSSRFGRLLPQDIGVAVVDRLLCMDCCRGF